MLQAYGGTLECRAAGDDVILAGRFPYGVQTELAPGRFEVMAPHALQTRMDTYLLAGHDFAKPLASRAAGTLTINDTADALTFEARLSPDVAGTTHGRDALALIRSGLAVGLSPGFRVGADDETITRENGHLLRTIRSAELFELSVVTRPAYGRAQVEARCWVTDLFKPMKPPAWYSYR